MLKLIIFKKNACVYIVGGTKKPIAEFKKDSSYVEIANELYYKLTNLFWDSCEGLYYKGKLHKIDNSRDITKNSLGMAKLIEKLVKGEN